MDQVYPGALSCLWLQTTSPGAVSQFKMYSLSVRKSIFLSSKDILDTNSHRREVDGVIL